MELQWDGPSPGGELSSGTRTCATAGTGSSADTTNGATTTGVIDTAAATGTGAGAATKQQSRLVLTFQPLLWSMQQSWCGDMAMAAHANAGAAINTRSVAAITNRNRVYRVTAPLEYQRHQAGSDANHNPATVAETARKKITRLLFQPFLHPNCFRAVNTVRFGGSSAMPRDHLYFQSS
jgi:hypothetical protein